MNLAYRDADAALRRVMAEQAKRAAVRVGERGLGTATDYAVALSGGRYARGVRHLELLMNALDDAAMHGGRRIIVEMPVRHGKSWSVSHYFPVSFLDRWPGRNIILTGYEASFARSWGRKVRNTIAEQRASLRVRLAADSTAADVFATTAGGGMVTAGTGGPITGRPADLLIVDDPIKNWQAAQSVAEREKVWEWWTGTAYPRLEPHASVVIVMARWHQDDLTGRLLEHAANGGDQWTRLRIPAIAEADDLLGREPGEALWPERYDVEALAKIRATVTPQVWSALYQQAPLPDGGATFKREWLGSIMAAPLPGDIVRAVRSWDCAASVGSGDWTVGALIAELRDGRYVVLDVVRVQAAPGDVDALIKATARADGATVEIVEEMEGGSSGKAVTDRRQRELVGYSYKAERPSGPKQVRWMGVAAAANAGRLWFVNAPWYRALVAELVAVPSAANDDQADALANGYNALTAPPALAPRVRTVGVAGFR